MDTDYLNFCPRLKTIIETGNSVNMRGEPVKIGGVSTLNNIRVLRELVLKKGCKRTLEIGLAYGGSALAILSTLKEGPNEDYHHTAIDPFQSKLWGGSSLRVIEEEGFNEHFTHCDGYSSIVLPDLCKQKKEFDLIYIDGSHIFEDVFIDFYYSTMLLSKNGLIAFDDCTDKHVKKVIKFIKANYKAILKQIDITSLEDPKKSFPKKVGNKLGIRQLYVFEKVSSPPREWDAPFVDF